MKIVLKLIQDLFKHFADLLFLCSFVQSLFVEVSEMICRQPFIKWVNQGMHFSDLLHVA
jgi:hypothetical protein